MRAIINRACRWRLRTRRSAGFMPALNQQPHTTQLIQLHVTSTLAGGRSQHTGERPAECRPGDRPAEASPHNLTTTPSLRCASLIWPMMASWRGSSTRTSSSPYSAQMKSPRQRTLYLDACAREPSPSSPRAVLAGGMPQRVANHNVSTRTAVRRQPRCAHR